MSRRDYITSKIVVGRCISKVYQSLSIYNYCKIFSSCSLSLSLVSNSQVDPYLWPPVRMDFNSPYPLRDSVIALIFGCSRNNRSTREINVRAPLSAEGYDLESKSGKATQFFDRQSSPTMVTYNGTSSTSSSNLIRM